jgi:hypothetical protein
MDHLPLSRKCWVLNVDERGDLTNDVNSALYEGTLAETIRWIRVQPSEISRSFVVKLQFTKDPVHYFVLEQLAHRHGTFGRDDKPPRMTVTEGVRGAS